MNISAIIPARNEADRMAHCVERAWAAGADEVIVVDGESDDATYAAAAATDCTLLRSAPGRAAQQNLGARRATGDVLLFLHADNWLAAGAAGQIRSSLASAKIDGGAFQQRIEAPGFAYRMIERGNAIRALRLKLPYGDQGIFLRRDLFLRLGGFPPVPIMEDFLFMHRHRALRLALLPGPIHASARRWKRHGIIRQTLRNWSLVTAQLLGVPPMHLARFYAPHLPGGRPPRCVPRDATGNANV